RRPDSRRSSETTSALTRTARSTSSRSTGEPGSAAAAGSDSIRSRIAGSAMKPHLTTSARPAVSSAAGRVSRVARSASTPAGGWNAPTRFLPAAVLTPVLPPTAASTMPSRLVGTATQRTPRSQAAATNPARSLAAPPPTPTTASVRVNPASPSASQQPAATSTVLPASASGTGSSSGATPEVRSWSATRRASCANGGAYTTAARAAPGSIAGSSASTSRPATTWYGGGPATSVTDRSPLTGPP